jgi:hypothetical protein
VLSAVEHICDAAMSDTLLDWQRQQADDIGLADTVPFRRGATSQSRH